jgi:DNA-directed RNA polymerase subunit L
MSMKEDELKKLARSTVVSDRAKAAYAARLPEEEVNMLASDSSVLVRNYVVKHPKLNKESAILLSQDENEQVRTRAYSHPVMPVEKLIEAWRDVTKQFDGSIQEINKKVQHADLIMDNPSLPNSEIDNFVEDIRINRTLKLNSEYSLETLLVQHIAYNGLGSEASYKEFVHIKNNNLSSSILGSDFVSHEKKFAFVIHGGRGGWDYLSNSSANMQQEFKAYLTDHMPELGVDFSNLTIPMVRTVFGENNDY